MAWKLSILTGQTSKGTHFNITSSPGYTDFRTDPPNGSLFNQPTQSNDLISLLCAGILVIIAPKLIRQTAYVKGSWMVRDVQRRRNGVFENVRHGNIEALRLRQEKIGTVNDGRLLKQNSLHIALTFHVHT
ncbi:hypothetical protein ANTQUA_LOCUS8747 [Anthophora quadrimaculata]